MNVLENLDKLVLSASSRMVERMGKSLPEGFSSQVALPKNAVHGDFSSRASFALAPLLKMNSMACAAKLLEGLAQTQGYADVVERSEAAEPGFVNFFLKKSALFSVLEDIFQKGAAFGTSQRLSHERVLFEFVSANPTGPLTVAHGRQAVLGDVLANVWACAGARVSRDYYLNDTGRQMRLLGESLWARCRELLGEPVTFPKEGYQGEYVRELATQFLAEHGESLPRSGGCGPTDQALDVFSAFAAKAILRGIEEDLAYAHVKFDRTFSEASLHASGAVGRALEKLKDRELLFEQDGALWFRSTAFGDDKDRVVRKATGELTYLAPDIAYHEEKFARPERYTRLVNFWGPDHHSYATRLKAACKALGHPETLTILIVQLVTLYRRGEQVRMSTRAGEFVTFRQLLEEVGVDAARFFYLMRKLESHLDFDLELAKEKSQENPVYYLQYAHARISSMLRKAGCTLERGAALDRLGKPEERELTKSLALFPGVMVRAALNFEPYQLLDYLRDVAAKFHLFYTLHRVVSEDQELMRARLLLSKAAQLVLQNGLRVLGISAPESM